MCLRDATYTGIHGRERLKLLAPVPEPIIRGGAVATWVWKLLIDRSHSCFFSRVVFHYLIHLLDILFSASSFIFPRALVMLTHTWHTTASEGYIAAKITSLSSVPPSSFGVISLLWQGLTLWPKLIWKLPCSSGWSQTLASQTLAFWMCHTKPIFSWLL